MSKNLVIVESPAKAKTISQFLGKDYTVLASMGHIRDLPKNTLGFDPENNFEAEYIVSPDKKTTIAGLKKHIEKDTTIWLATDEDREGEAISWHLVSALKIQKHPLKRIAFHEITKPAILDAIKNPREIDTNLVNAQQARRILDRAVGYELSPLLWKKIKFGLSAGRVQSVAVRLIVDREREIRAFKPEEFWKIFTVTKDPKIKTELVKIQGKTAVVPNRDTAMAIKESVLEGEFTLSDIQEKEGKRSPAPPFTTSTLQQEASRKLGFSVKQTMVLAQQLYEGNFSIPGYSGGLITYMRTDSLNLANTALEEAKKVVIEEFGAEYAVKSPRRFTTKNKSAQEAHEAIRPVSLSMKPSSVKTYLDAQAFRLYELIWKRTLATQMTEAKIANTIYSFTAGKNKEYIFEARGQKMLFAGFIRAYTEGADDPEEMLSSDDSILPHVPANTILDIETVETEQRFTKPPARYTEASLIKKLESEGIGRPSTYAPTISTIESREYTEKTEDKRLKPTDIGETVNDFLVKHFPNIVDYSFTATMENSLDEVAEGKLEWTKLMKDFYFDFHELVGEKEQTVSREESLKTRNLGDDPKTGKPVSVRMGRFGPFVQIGSKEDEDKPSFASIPKEISLEEISLEEALKLFSLPRVLGTDTEGKEIQVNRGRFGPFVKVGSEYFSLKKEDDPMTITLDRALQIIQEGKEKKAKSLLKDFGDIQILQGPFGPYIKKEKSNFKIPKDTNIEKLTLADCEDIISKAPAKKKFVRKKKS